jgi:uncharacterized protein YbcI
LTVGPEQSGSATSTESQHPPLTAICDEAAALHREHFGRGPGAVRTRMIDDLIICILSGVFTPPERILIDAGRGDQVLKTRLIHHDAVEAICKQRITAIAGREVIAHLSTVRPDEDMVVDVYMLGPEGTEGGSTATRTDSFH